MINKNATLTSDCGDAVVLRSVQARGRLSGLLLTMTLRQVFRNDESRHIEVTYTFPLPWGAVLTGLEATLGDKRMRGEVMARREAAQKYEDAVEQGDAPVMVEKNFDGSFTASLGSLKPGEEAVVELSYAQLLNFEQGRVRCVVPTTIAPRYGDPVAQGWLPIHQAAQPDLLAEFAFSLELTVSGPLARAQLSCPSHRVERLVSDGEVRLATCGDAWLDRDFVVLMEGLQGQSLAVAGPDPASGKDHHAMIASFCPYRAARAAPALSLKILVDCSGSMGGDSIQQARLALEALAAQLKGEDLFTYSRFGSAPMLVLGSTPASTRGLRDLRAAIAGTDADLGGTEMDAAFEHVFDLSVPSTPDAPETDVLVITDGAVWDVQAILARARQGGHRVYALGVGSAPAESLLRELAEATGGACEFATPNEDMVAAMKRLVARVRSASAVQATLTGEPAPLWRSPLPRRVASDETVHVHLRLPARPQAAPGLEVDGERSEANEITWLADDLVARLVAACQITHIAPENSDEAAEWAERYQLVTDRTNMLLVFERADSEKTDGMPVLRKVRPMLAAGAGAAGSVRHGIHAAFAQTGSRVVSPMVTSSPLRSLQTRWEPLDSEGPDEIGIPAILRRNAESTALSMKLGALRLMEFMVDRLAPSKAQPALEGRAAAFDIVRTFNSAVQPGLSFRQVLRSVTERSLDPRILMAVEHAAESAGTRVKGWACFLLWVHHLNAPEAQLSDAALALVMAQLQGVDARRQFAVTPLFEVATA